MCFFKYIAHVTLNPFEEFYYISQVHFTVHVSPNSNSPSLLTIYGNITKTLENIMWKIKFYINDCLLWTFTKPSLLYVWMLMLIKLWMSCHICLRFLNFNPWLSTAVLKWPQILMFVMSLKGRNMQLLFFRHWAYM